jgi:hypothetical protein
MFKKNNKHQQPALISAASELPEKQRKRLENSWAGTFYQEFFCRIDETVFAVLYSEAGSRPNVAVNVLVGLEALKAGHGWSDEELYENFCYNLQVRYALGYDRLGDGDFEIRSLYYFRERMRKYNAEKGVNLLEKAFEQITDAQIVALKVRTGMQRMDSTQIASNIVWASRLQLLVEAVQRVERILSDAEKLRLAETFAPYTKDSSGHYTYRVKGKETVQEHLQKIGQTIHTLLVELKTDYAPQNAYQVLERIFTENFELLEQGPRTKENAEITSGCLQSVDDLEATDRTKGVGRYKGYVANLTETCDPENELQPITKVQVAPHNIDDTQLLAEALPNLKERTNVETMITDGGYGGEVSDLALQLQDVKLVQTAIRGLQPNQAKFHLADFDLQVDEQGNPSRLTCPAEQTTALTITRTGRWQARFDPMVCTTCPFQVIGRCRAQAQTRDPRYLLAFNSQEVLTAKRRKEYLAHKGNGHNLRSAVEATVRSVKHPFPAGKLPVRGQHRVTCLTIASAATANVRRIHRYLEAKAKALLAAAITENEANCLSIAEPVSFLTFFSAKLSGWLFPKCVFAQLSFGKV